MNDTTENSFIPSFRYNTLTAIAGFTSFDPAAGGFVINEITLGSDEARFAMGISWRRSGWNLIGPAGSGVFDVVTVPAGQPLPQRPSDNHKPCRAVPLWSPLTQEVNWTISSWNMVQTFDHLINATRRYEEATRGLQPIVFFAGVHEVWNQKQGGNLYLLDMRIEDWVDPQAIPCFRDRPPTVPPPVILPVQPHHPGPASLPSGAAASPETAKPAKAAGWPQSRRVESARPVSPSPKRESLEDLLDDDISDLGGKKG